MCLHVCVFLVRATETGAPAGSHINIHGGACEPYIDQAIADSRRGSIVLHRRTVLLTYLFLFWRAKKDPVGAAIVAACSIYSCQKGKVCCWAMCVCVCKHTIYVCCRKCLHDHLTRSRFEMALLWVYNGRYCKAAPTKCYFRHFYI